MIPRRRYLVEQTSLSASAATAGQRQQSGAHGHHSHGFRHGVQAHIVKANVAFATHRGPRKTNRNRLPNHRARTRRGVNQAERVHGATAHGHGVGGQQSAARHHTVGQRAASPEFGRAARAATGSTLQVVQGVGAVGHKDIAQLLGKGVVAIRKRDIQPILAGRTGMPDSSVCTTRRRRAPTRHLGGRVEERSTAKGGVLKTMIRN